MMTPDDVVRLRELDQGPVPPWEEEPDEHAGAVSAAETRPVACDTSDEESDEPTVPEDEEWWIAHRAGVEIALVRRADLRDRPPVPDPFARERALLANARGVATVPEALAHACLARRVRFAF